MSSISGLANVDHAAIRALLQGSINVTNSGSAAERSAQEWDNRDIIEQVSRLDAQATRRFFDGIVPANALEASWLVSLREWITHPQELATVLEALDAPNAEEMDRILRENPRTAVVADWLKSGAAAEWGADDSDDQLTASDFATGRIRV